jgi:hypothetical protein
MNRRTFFGSLAALVAGATLDPEKLLWVPGRKLISIPALRGGEDIRNCTQPNFMIAAPIWQREVGVTFTWCYSHPAQQAPAELRSRRGESYRSYIDRTLQWAPDPYASYRARFITRS